MQEDIPFKYRWLSNGVPDHWKIVEPRRIFKLRREPEKPGDIHLTPSQKYGVIPQEEYMRITGSRVVQNLSGMQMQHVEPGDFISHLRTFQGGLELVTQPGKISPAYTVLKPTEAVYPGYFKHVFKSEGYISQIASVTDQLRDGQSMRYNEFNLTWLPLPPYQEQIVISKLLDRELTEVNRLIADHERLQVLLEERLNASVEHEMWNQDFDLISIKHLASILPGFAFKSSDFSEDASQVPLIRGINVGVGDLKWNETVYLDRSRAPEHNLYRLKKNDLVLGLDRPLIGAGVRVAMVGKPDEGSLLVQRVARIRASSGLASADWIMHSLSSSRFKAYLEPIFTGVSVPHTSPEQLGNFRIPLPEKEVILNINSGIQRKAETHKRIKHNLKKLNQILNYRKLSLSSKTLGL